MRVAFVFSGLLRELDENANTILRKIYELNADVYGSFWDIEDQNNNSTVANFIKTYNPKKIEIESYNVWENSNWEIIKEEYYTDHLYHRLNYSEYQNILRPNIFAMWYKIWRANMLTKYNDSEYDVVVRLRTDLRLSDKFTVTINNCINFPYGTVHITEWLNCFGPHDLIVYGNPNIMDYFSSLYLYMSRYLKEGVYFYPYENILRHHLSQKPMNIRFYSDYVGLRNGGVYDFDVPDNTHSSEDWKLDMDPNLSFYKKIG